MRRFSNAVGRTRFLGLTQRFCLAELGEALRVSFVSVPQHLHPQLRVGDANRNSHLRTNSDVITP
jgi:hypothetical protein